VTSALQDIPLSLGFAVAFGTRNTLGTGSDDVVSAETLLMIKERFIEQYGLPKFTIGSGGSGGAIQQHLIAYNYPGLLDALTPKSGIWMSSPVAIDGDRLHLLSNYFDNKATLPTGREPLERSTAALRMMGGGARRYARRGRGLPKRGDARAAVPNRGLTQWCRWSFATTCHESLGASRGTWQQRREPRR
jgi:hypothetical protein